MRFLFFRKFHPQHRIAKYYLVGYCLAEHRIELGEIESAAERGEGVGRAVGVYNADSKEIVLFYVGETEDKQLLGALTCALPRYMLPARLVKMTALPLTDNGKINRTYLKSLAANEN